MNSHLFGQSRKIWEPQNGHGSRLNSLRNMINRKHGLNLKDYHDLHKYSVEDYMFWQDLWEYLGIIYSVPATAIVEPGRLPEIPNWFPGARLNYAENILFRNDDGIAVTAAREFGLVEHYSFRQLRGHVRRMAAAMRAHGLRVGDRVAAVITNSFSAVVVALATSSIGAIYTSTAADMGTQGILDRYRQIQPKFLFFDTEVVYAGKTFDLLTKISEVAKDLVPRGLQHVILLPSTKTGKEVTQEQTARVSNSIALSDFLKEDDGRPLQFEQLPFGQPLYILYSSGTSGPPKCIIHGQGGVLMQNKKEIALVYGCTFDDCYFQYTTTGWMMWPLMLSTMALGGRILVYDGSPFHPSVEAFLKFVSDQGVTIFGTSPRFLTEVQARGILPSQLASFPSLRALMSTGAPLTPPMFEWAQAAFRKDVFLTSPSGGTDICSSFITGVPAMPVYAGETQGKSLGVKTQIFDPSGNDIEASGQPGELVCTRPHVSLPIGFWGDEDGKKLRAAYFDTYPGVWRQGDFIVANPVTKGLIILGRSDGVLNPSGVRFGSAEIYTVMDQFTEVIDDSLCVGQRRSTDKDERVLLFVKMRPGHHLTAELADKIRDAIRSALSPRHVPAYIFETAAIPYTVNNKKIEIAVKQIVSGLNIKPSGTVANPESLDLYYKYRDIENVAQHDGVNRVKAKL
ncbi:acetoacetate-CoA ligase [Gloeophyllum trabeum ATCC 11539]|uniref:Acetoacetate-CoA ligase n=1 Tax=Gloeophyllum trabeum (strain ATCC 11539 / FP-39264 / Madison 617) TaxID=670483 RepID=S7RUL9_GLOTA|nr:acetoacetate-CoA ligase [Gloeophyllum trabeum ATCC 11539]EPQ56899.1 acetoacetate-CoA ligase [Gloeophyllum trabeum ATCC 11539]